MSATIVRCRAPSPLAVRGEDRALRSRRRGCCAALTNPNLPGWVDAPATMTPLGSNRASKRVARRRSRRHLDQRVDGDGRPSTTISGLRSARHDRRVGLGRGRTGRRARRRARSRSTGGSPRNSPSRRWVARSSIISSASTRVDRHEAEGDVGDGLGEDAADAEHHGHAELRVAVQPGDQLAVAARPSARRAGATSPSSGRAAASSSRGRLAHRVGVAEAEPHQAALGLVGDGVAAQLQHHRVAERRRRRPPRRRRVATSRSSGNGTPCAASSAFDSASERVGHGVRTVAARGDRGPIGRDRGLLRPAVDVGRRVADVARGAPARGMTRLRLRAEGRPEAPRPLARALRRRRARRVRAASPTTGALRLGFAISPGLSIDYDDADDRAALAAKVDQVVGGRRRPRGARPRRHPVRRRPAGRGPRARSPRWLRDHLGDRADLALVPTEYVGIALDPVPRRAGRRACPTTCRSAGPATPWSTTRSPSPQAEARAAPLGGRPPLLWDNYPVNDGSWPTGSSSARCGGASPACADACAGYLANPMVQPRASTLPLASIAAWLRGEDPLDGVGGRRRPTSAGACSPRLRRRRAARRGRGRSAGGDLARRLAHAGSPTRPPARRPGSRTRPAVAQAGARRGPPRADAPSTCSTATREPSTRPSLGVRVGCAGRPSAARARSR